MPDINLNTQNLLSRYIQVQSASSPPQLDSYRLQRRQSYRQAAAVLHGFVPQGLQPLDLKFLDKQPWSVLQDDMVRLPGADTASLYALKLDVRRQALQELKTRSAMQDALNANPQRAKSPLQDQWEAYLSSGKFPDMNSQGYSELTQLHQIATWVEGILPDIPAAAEVLALVRRKSVLASFEHLVTNNFTGRQKELARLREHIGAMPPATDWHAIERQWKAWLGIKPRHILAICGPGGIGKTALVGRMLWEHSHADPQARIPFAYLPFDQPNLRIESPFTLLVEAAAQLELQYPENNSAIHLFHSQVREFRDARAPLLQHQQLSESSITRMHDVDEGLYRQFAQLLATLARRGGNNQVVQSPVLFALDTFEEVQFRDRESLAGLWRMLNIISAAYPPFRVVISGRGSIAHGADKLARIEEFQLEELSLPDRVHLLQGLGVAEEQLAKALAAQVGGNPLSLQLAAGVVRADATAATRSGLRNLKTHDWYVFRVDEEIIQGQLYRRVLDHIHDPDVRQLAHPGMVLRRVDPAVIRFVLAPFCKIVLTPARDEHFLFGELKREHTLVQIGDDGALVYRPEVRRAMIRLLEQDKFREVRELHRAAIRYYENQPGELNRAEEIYHRLVLNEDEPAHLSLRWNQGVDQQSVVANLEEYPHRSQAWLASQMSLEIDRKILEEASAEEWERNITRKAQRALSSLDLKGALSLLSERDERSTASPLYALTAKTYLLMKDLDQAWDVLERGIHQVTGAPNRGRLAELYWLQAQIAVRRNDPLAADALFQQAEEALSQGVKHGSNPLPLVHVLCQRLLLRKVFSVAYAEPAAPIRLRLSQACDRLPDSVPLASQFVLRQALELLQREFPQTSQRLQPLVLMSPPTNAPAANLELLTNENLQGLEEYRESWEK
jgi:hypothetical protein